MHYNSFRCNVCKPLVDLTKLNHWYAMESKKKKKKRKKKKWNEMNWNESVKFTYNTASFTQEYRTIKCNRSKNIKAAAVVSAAPTKMSTTTAYFTLPNILRTSVAHVNQIDVLPTTEVEKKKERKENHPKLPKVTMKHRHR